MTLDHSRGPSEMFIQSTGCLLGANKEMHFISDRAMGEALRMSTFPLAISPWATSNHYQFFTDIFDRKFPRLYFLPKK